MTFEQSFKETLIKIADLGMSAPASKLRISGGAPNVGVTRPPIPSNYKATAVANKIRQAASTRRTPGAVVNVPVQ